MRYTLENGALTLWLQGRIDSGNASETEAEIQKLLPGARTLVLDCQALEYISSAGLRVILRTAKTLPDMKLVNVAPEQYDIFEMTGFTEILEVHKALRVISVANCEIIGQGANGKVYRIDPETVVKVYRNPEALEEIQRERELARTAFVLGIPTAIPYDVVRIEGGGCGSVFELLNAANFSELLLRGEKSLEEIVSMSVELLKTIHATQAKPGSMPSMRERALDWAAFLRKSLPGPMTDRLSRLMEALPEDCHIIHGDFHIKNIHRQGQENLILDMETLAQGHPIFDLAFMFNAYVGFYTADPQRPHYLGIDHALSRRIWDCSLRRYLSDGEEARVREVEDKAKVLGYTRLLRRVLRRDGLSTEAGRREIACYQACLKELLPRVDSLSF